MNWRIFTNYAESGRIMAIRGNLMKATGIVRRIDHLGRIVLPIELRRKMEIGTEETLEFFVEGETLLLKRYAPACTFCGANKELKEYNGKRICAACLNELKTEESG